MTESKPEIQKLSLDVEDVKREVAVEVAAAAPAPEAEAVDPEIEAKATAFADMLAELDVDDMKARKERSEAIENAGRKVQQEAAHRSKMLEEPIRALSSKTDDGGDVAQSLLALKSQVESLDPNRLDLQQGWFARTLGKLPFVGSPLERYFTQYESAQSVIDQILRSLEKGREQLERDNITLADDQRVMRELTLSIGKQVTLLRQIDAKLQAKLDRDIPSDDPKHAFLAEEIVYPLRQRIQDLLQQLAVNQQGVLAIELIVRNNKELVRGVNRAMDVTVGALQVAVTVALALAHQKIVLDKITALNTTTSDLIAGTAAKLRTTGAEIHRQGANSMLDMDKLKSAFNDVNAALDDVASFRREALPKMAEQIGELDALSRKGNEAIAKLEEGNEIAPALQIDIDDDAPNKGA